MSPIDIVTISFDSEIALLRLQARSLRLKMEPHLVGNIFVIINQSDTRRFRDKFFREVAAEYGDLGKKVSLLDAADLMPMLEQAGWRTQQSLKLLAHSLVDSQEYLVLDTKNHLIKPISREWLLEDDGRKISHISPARGALLKFFGPSFTAFGLDGEKYADTAMPATTPYLMGKKLTENMIREIEERHQVDFLKFFHVKHRNTTEFFLYNAFLAASELVDTEYAFRPAICAALFAVFPETDDKFRWVINKAREDNIRCFALHRNRIEKLSEWQRDAVADVWYSSGLISAPEEALQFFQKLEFNED